MAKLKAASVLIGILVSTSITADEHSVDPFAADDRPSSDYEQHETRKAREVLAFTGMKRATATRSTGSFPCCSPGLLPIVTVWQIRIRAV